MQFLLLAVKNESGTATQQMVNLAHVEIIGTSISGDAVLSMVSGKAVYTLNSFEYVTNHIPER